MKISSSLLILLSALTFQVSAKTLTWNPGNPDQTPINATDPAASPWVEGGYFESGDNLIIGNGRAYVNGVMDLGGGSISFGNGTSGNVVFDARGRSGSITGKGTILIDVGTARLEHNNVTLFKDFEGDFYVKSGYLKAGQGKYGDMYMGSGTIIVDSELRVELGSDTDTETQTNRLKTDVRLNDGATIRSHSTAWLNLDADLAIGNGTEDATATWSGRGTDSRVAGFNIYGKLSGSAGSVFILDAREGGTDIKDAGLPTHTVNLHESNSYEGTLRVVSRQNGRGTELHLKNAGAAQYATVDLQGGGNSTSSLLNAGQARLVVDVASATVNKLVGNTNSIVTSSIASALTVNSGDFKGVIEDGAGLALVKSGGGTLTLGSANAYAGGTTITAGTLVAADTNALGEGNVTLNGGTLELGVDSLTLGGDLIFNGGQLTLNATDDFIQQIIGSGTLTLSGGTLLIDMSAYTELDISVTDFFSGFNNMSALDFANITIKNSEGLIGSVGADGKITFSAIPEPSTTALFALAAFGLIGRRNRKVATVA